MIDGLKPYPAVKDSGVAWLGEVPAGWGLVNLSSLTSRISRSGRTDLPLLSVARERGVFVRSATDEGNHNIIPDDLTNYRVARQGDLVINKMKAWQGSLGIAPVDGVVSPAYFVFDFRMGDRRFGQALLRSKPYVWFFAQASDGVRIGQWDLSIQGMKRIPVPVPSLPEQHLIVRFLDHADRRIRRLIAAKQRMIKLLEEQKRAIIHQAVTRGLDSNVRMKPSGVSWLGDVPAHWTMGRVKTECRNLNTLRVPLSSPERGKMVTREYDYYGASGVIDKVDGYLFDDHLVLIAEDGANLVNRNLPLAVIAKGKFWVNNHAHILKPLKNLLYFAALLECVDYRAWITGAAQPKLTQDRLMAVRIPVPPRAEQDAIVAWIEAQTGGVAATVQTARSEILLLREYRTRLIADVVTGKLDVRAAAALLRDESSPDPVGLDDDLPDDLDPSEDSPSEESEP